MSHVTRPLVKLTEIFPRLNSPFLSWIGAVGERALCLDTINRIHADCIAETDTGKFLRAALDGFGVSFEVKPEELARIPVEGPVIVVSNHPFGGIDAIVLASVLRSVRPDARVLANHLLERMPQVRPVILPVDPFGGLAAARRNVRGMQRAMAHLESGGLLGIFPSGAVSHFHWSSMDVVDPAWTDHLAKLVQRTRATVVPVYFHGRNSILFQLAGLIHPLLRTAMIPRESVKRRGTTVKLTIGNPISCTRLERLREPARFTRFLRMRTYVLGGAGAADPKVRQAAAEPLAGAEDREELAREIARVTESDVLVREGEFFVVMTRAAESPALMREIGRLREETFRAAGEGTGRDRDIDSFDRDYHQLVLWDAAERRVAGGYRVARVDECLAQKGERGLYTTTLFHFRPGFFKRLGPAMELGRSWIRHEYQRKHNALALLWRGIAALVVRQPECCVLLGPVSISRDYQPLSRGLIVSFLKHAVLDRRLAAYVRPSRPYRMRGRHAQLARDVGSAVNTIDDVSLLVSEIEGDGKGVPLLFRHYLRLHSIVLSFNVDPAFADVVDGLLVTDLRRTDATLLRRFMGNDGYATFAAHHGLSGAGDRSDAAGDASDPAAHVGRPS